MYCLSDLSLDAGQHLVFFLPITCVKRTLRGHTERTSDISVHILSRWPSCSSGGTSAHALQKARGMRQEDSPGFWSLLSDSLCALVSVGTHCAEDTQSVPVAQCLRGIRCGAKMRNGVFCCFLSFYKPLLVAFNRILRSLVSLFTSLSM